MKRSVIEQRLKDAEARKRSAVAQEYYLDGRIRYHDEEASILRKERQKERARKSRADAAIRKLSVALQYQK